MCLCLLGCQKAKDDMGSGLAKDGYLSSSETELLIEQTEQETESTETLKERNARIQQASISIIACDMFSASLPYGWHNKSCTESITGDIEDNALEFYKGVVRDDDSITDLSEHAMIRLSMYEPDYIPVTMESVAANVKTEEVTDIRGKVWIGFTGEYDGKDIFSLTARDEEQCYVASGVLSGTESHTELTDDDFVLILSSIRPMNFDELADEGDIEALAVKLGGALPYETENVERVEDTEGVLSVSFNQVPMSASDIDTCLKKIDRDDPRVTASLFVASLYHFSENRENFVETLNLFSVNENRNFISYYAYSKLSKNELLASVYFSGATADNDYQASLPLTVKTRMVGNIEVVGDLEIATVQVLSSVSSDTHEIRLVKTEEGWRVLDCKSLMQDFDAD